MNYPANITLRKIKTLEDAKVPQREKYPDGTERHGLMWEYTRPHVGLPFVIYESKLHPTFRTSIVIKILEAMNNRIIFKTYNSMYELILTDIPAE